MVPDVVAGEAETAAESAWRCRQMGRERKRFAIATKCIVLGPKLKFGLVKETSIFAFLSKAEKTKADCTIYTV